MTLIRTSLLNGIAVMIKMLTLLGINKVLAIYVGPSGYAALGQFQNAVQMITTFASGAINNGVTKYTSEYYEDDQKQRAVWRTAGSVALIGSLVTGFLVALFSKQLASWFLKDEHYSGVFIWFGATLVLFVLNSLLLAILNGKKDIRRYVLANIAGSLFALLITVILSMQFGLYGALVSLAIYQSVSFIITLLLCRGAHWFRFSYLFGNIDKQTVSNLGKYTAMALTSAVCVPLSHILVRNHLGETLGWAAAGYWEAMWRLSSAYLILVTSTLGVYYLPRLSEIKTIQEIKLEIMLGYKIIMPATIFISIGIYIARDSIINILFTEEFIPIRSLFFWQLIGDTLKIGSWIAAYVLLSRAWVKLYIISEVIFSFSFLIITIALEPLYALESVVIAHAINYGLYWITIILILIIKFRSYRKNEDIVTW